MKLEKLLLQIDKGPKIMNGFRKKIGIFMEDKSTEGYEV